MRRNPWVLGAGSLVVLALSCGGRVGVDDSEFGGGGGDGNIGGKAGSGGGSVAGNGGSIAGSGGKISGGGKSSGSGGTSSGSGGRAGMGGFVATGGSATGGAVIGRGGGSAGGPPSPYKCAASTLHPGADVPIADYESIVTPYDVTSNNGLLSGSYVYTDPNDARASSSAMLVPGREPASKQAFHATILSTTWGGGMGVWFESCLDLWHFPGISFWARGFTPTRSIRLSLGTIDVLPRSEGGGCDADGTVCAAAEVRLTLSDSWQQYVVTWGEFSPAVNSDGVFYQDGRNIRSINVQLENDYAPHELWLELDDLEPAVFRF